MDISAIRLAYDGDMAMKATTTASEIGRKHRGPRDPALRRALLRAMREALRRSVVLLPLTEDEDRLQEFPGRALGLSGSLQ
jgi:hypothetical protein